MLPARRRWFSASRQNTSGGAGMQDRAFQWDRASTMIRPALVGSAAVTLDLADGWGGSNWAVEEAVAGADAGGRVCHQFSSGRFQVLRRANALFIVEPLPGERIDEG